MNVGNSSSNATYREIQSDVIAYAKSIVQDRAKQVIIPHVCNNVGVMGAGVAAALRAEWPSIMPVYKRLCTQHGLGYTYMAPVAPGLYVANMISQDNYGYAVGRPPIRYAALGKCMRRVLCHMRQLSMGDIQIVAPAFGSALAGGDWDIIQQMIMEVWVDNGFDVTICRI